MVKDVTQFHKCHLGFGVCLYMCVRVQGFMQDFEFWKGGGGNSTKFGVDLEGVYST